MKKNRFLFLFILCALFTNISAINWKFTNNSGENITVTKQLGFADRIDSYGKSFAWQGATGFVTPLALFAHAYFCQPSASPAPLLFLFLTPVAVGLARQDSNIKSQFIGALAGTGLAIPIGQAALLIREMVHDLLKQPVQIPAAVPVPPPLPPLVLPLP
jgi:hypothetical protein